MLSNHNSFWGFIFSLNVLLKMILAPILLFSLNSYGKTSTNIFFNESEVISPFELTHPVLAINLLEKKGKELVTFSLDDSGQQWLLVYAFDETKEYKEVYRTRLPKDFYSFDISSPQNTKRQTLYFLSSNHIYILNEALIADQSTFQLIHTISSMAKGNNKQYLEKGNFLTVLNNDDYDDIYIADFNAAHILIQTDKGFKTSSLPIKAESLFTHEVIQYFRTTTYFEDVNFDGLMDIIYIDEGQFTYFLQQEDLTISPVPYTIEINKQISSLDWWNKLGADGENLDQSNLSARKVEQLRDINNDSIIDMVVRFTQSEGVLSKTNDYEIYLGRKVENKLQFMEEPNSTIQAEGTLTDIQFVDINNDRKDEVLVAGFDIGLSQIISALLSGSIDQDVHLFYMDDASNFNRKNKVSKEVELNFSLSSGSSGKPIATLLDVDGDKRQDLVLSDDNDTLKIYLGASHKRLFARKSIKHRVRLPKQGDMLITSDINDDGKDDILIKYGREDKSDLRKKIRILISP